MSKASKSVPLSGFRARWERRAFLNIAIVFSFFLHTLFSSPHGFCRPDIHDDDIEYDN